MDKRLSAFTRILWTKLRHNGSGNEIGLLKAGITFFYRTIWFFHWTQAEYCYFSVDFRLKIFLWIFLDYIAYDISVLECIWVSTTNEYDTGITSCRNITEHWTDGYCCHCWFFGQFVCCLEKGQTSYGLVRNI